MESEPLLSLNGRRKPFLYELGWKHAALLMLIIYVMCMLVHVESLRIRFRLLIKENAVKPAVIRKFVALTVFGVQRT